MRFPLLLAGLLLLAACDSVDPFGPDPANPPPPAFTRAYVTQIQLDAIPMTRPDGTGWDALSGPDVYITFADTNGNQLFRSATKQDVGTSHFPLQYNLGSWQITDLSRTICMYVWDEDVTQDEYIGSAGCFAAEDFRGTTTLNSAAGSPIRLALTLRWE